MNTATVYTALATAFAARGLVAAPFTREARPDPAVNLYISITSLAQQREPFDVTRASVDLTAFGTELTAQDLLDALDPLIQDDISGTSTTSGDIAILEPPSVDALAVQVNPDTADTTTTATLTLYIR